MLWWNVFGWLVHLEKVIWAQFVGKGFTIKIAKECYWYIFATLAPLLVSWQNTFSPLPWDCVRWKPGTVSRLINLDGIIFPTDSNTHSSQQSGSIYCWPTELPLSTTGSKHLRCYGDYLAHWSKFWWRSVDCQLAFLKVWIVTRPDFVPYWHQNSIDFLPSHLSYHDEHKHPI